MAKKRKQTRTKDHPELGWPDTELIAALNSLIAQLGGGSKKRGGVQKLASEMHVSANIVHLWRRPVQGVEAAAKEKNLRVKLVPTLLQAVKLARIEAQTKTGSMHTPLEVCQKWLRITGREGEKDSDLLVSKIVNGPEKEILVSTEDVFSELHQRLVDVGLRHYRPLTAIAAYFTQAAFRKYSSHWRPPKRRLAIFWSAQSPAFPPHADKSGQHAMHDFFREQMKPLSDKPSPDRMNQQTPTSFSTGIDVYITGQDRSSHEDLLAYIQKHYKLPSSGNVLPTVRFFEARSSEWDQQRNLEHLADAFVFHGEDALSEDRDFMMLVGEVDRQTLETLTLDKERDPIFENPYLFASQLMRLPWGKTSDFLHKRGIRIEAGVMVSDSSLWEPVVIKGCEQWQLKSSST
jgi:hypothetical protein